MRVHLSTEREALRAQVEIYALHTSNPNLLCDIIIAIVAMILDI